MINVTRTKTSGPLRDFHYVVDRICCTWNNGDSWRAMRKGTSIWKGLVTGGRHGSYILRRKIPEEEGDRTYEGTVYRCSEWKDRRRRTFCLFTPSPSNLSPFRICYHKTVPTAIRNGSPQVFPRFLTGGFSKWPPKTETHLLPKTTLPLPGPCLSDWVSITTSTLR